MHFVIEAIDRPGTEDLRQATRADHLAYLERTGVTRIAGPFLSDDGLPIGSLLIIEAENMAAAEAFAAADPYAKAGLFVVTVIRPWRWVIGRPEGA